MAQSSRFYLCCCLCLKSYPRLIPIYRITVWINPKNSDMEKAGEELDHDAHQRRTTPIR